MWRSAEAFHLPRHRPGSLRDRRLPSPGGCGPGRRSQPFPSAGRDLGGGRLDADGHARDSLDGGARAHVGPGDVVAVIGLGAVGLQAVMCSLAMGAARVLGIDLLPDRRRHAEELGAEGVEDPDALAAVREATGGHGVDVVIDANGGPVTTAMAVEMIARGGRVSVVGISEHQNIAFPIKAGLYKNMEVHTGICSAQLEVPALLRELESGRLDGDAITRLTTHRMNLSEGAAAYAFFDSRKDGVLKVALDPTA